MALNSGEPSQRRRWRGPILVLLIVLTLVTAGVGLWRWQLLRAEVADQSVPAGPEVSQSFAPEFALQDLAGDTIRLSQLRGSVVLLNFWATWCPPCEAEMPDLNALYREYGDEKGFVVVGINNRESRDVIQKFVSDRELLFPVLLDSDGSVTLKRFAVRVLPMSLIIDREGKVRDAWQGQIAREAMLARLQRVW